jgi:hypothetical protein
MADIIERFPSYNAAILNEPAYQALHPDHASIMAPQSSLTKKEAATLQVTEVNDELRSLTITPALSESAPGLFITGIGSQYPPFTIKPEQLENNLKKWCDVGTPA